MKGFDTLKIKAAKKDNKGMDLSSTHLTTMDFGQIVPLYCSELIPGDKFNIKANYFSRLAPLVKPTYGKFQFKTMASFVPYFQLADEAEAYLAGKTIWEGTTPDLRWIKVTDLTYWLINYTGAQYVSAGARDTYDFSYKDNAGTQRYIKFTGAAKYAYKVLCSLGYALPENMDEQANSPWSTTMANVKVNAMPLLAFAKAYNDWMSQSQRYNTSQLTGLLRDIKHNNHITGSYVAATHLLVAGALSTIFDNIKLTYENDYFTSAWQNPNAPLNSLEIMNSTTVPGTSADWVFSNAVNDNLETPVWTAVGGGNYVSINQRSLDFLKSFDDWVRRNNYSGSRAVQQIYSRFGIKTDDYRSNYAQVISTDSTPIQVGDVTAMASSSQESLGDYAGKGIMADNKAVSYDAKDYGMLFIFGWFTITPMMAYGYDKNVLRMTPLDYYNPEFDGIGAQAISYGEVYTDPDVATGDTTTDRDVFGFTERYNEYRFGKDRITGEFRGFGDSDMNTWHTGRLLSDVRHNGQMVAQSSAMNTLPQSDSEYNRIFSVTSGNIDHFYLTAQFDVNAVRPMLSLNQVPRLGEGDLQVSRNGNEIN